MNEIPTDLIARIATKIYNEQPVTNAAASSVAPMPVMPAAEPAAPPTAAVAFSPAALPSGATPLPTAHPAMPAFPTGAQEAAPPHASVANVASGDTYPGLKAFVAQVRSGSFSGRDGVNADPIQSLKHRLSAAPSAPGATSDPRAFDVAAIRNDFPILKQQINGRPLVWFDNAATTQKPQAVINALSRFYERDNSNIHRGAHALAARATDAYESARSKVASFLGAGSSKEIVFARGATEGVNLIANTWGHKFLQPGDEIVLSMLEHHANIVPWQMVARQHGAGLRVIPVNDAGEILLAEYQRLLGPRTRLVALAHANNSLGTILPVAEMTQMAKRFGARVLIDGAQSVAHLPFNVKQLGADFYVFSGHKIFGPTGIGAVYIAEELHDVLPPWQGGGNMIRNVTFEETTYAEAPAKFEAGTPNIADAVGLGAALDYVSRLGLPAIARYEHELLVYATERLRRVPGLRLIGQAREKVGVLSFVLPHLTTEQVGQRLNQEGIAVRAGHHCAQPSLRRFGLESTVRPSLSLYNTHDEIDLLCSVLKSLAATK